MTSPDNSPPSSSPPTTRDPEKWTHCSIGGHEFPPRRRTGGLDPYPPNPGARLLMLAPHGVLVLELVAVSALARGSVMLLALPALLVVSAWAAWLLARLDARHRPIAIGLGAWAALALLGRVLGVTVLAEPGPYSGWARVAFHLEEATRLVTAALPAWMALATLRKYPPGPSAWRSRMSAAFIACVAFLSGGLAANYPSARGDILRQVYLGAEFAGLFVASVAIVSWARWRLADRARMAIAVKEERVEEGADLLIRSVLEPQWYTWAPIVWLVAGDLLLLLVGAWRYGLFGEAYQVQQWGLLVVWGCVAAMQAAALVMARRRGS